MVDQLQPKRRRILFVAHQACGNPALCAEVRAHAVGAADVLVVAPVLSSPLHRWTSDDSEDRALAEERLEASIGCLRRHGLRAHGTLGDADPVQAIADALFGFPPTRSPSAWRSRSVRTGFARVWSSARGSASRFW